MKRRRAIFLGLIAVAILILALLFVVFAFQRSQQPVQNQKTPGATATISGSYPANVEFDNPGTYPYGGYNPASLSNSNVGGVVINFSWGAVEPQQGVFNFAPADNEIAAWVHAGKKVVFQVRFLKQGGVASVPNCGAANQGDDLPVWEVNRIPHLCQSFRGMIIPNYFSPTFQADAKAFVSAVAQHYSNSPYRSSIVYVRVATGTGGEQNLLQGCRSPSCRSEYQADVQQLMSWGYSPAALITYDENMLSFDKSVFNYTTVMYALGGPIPQVGKLNINPETGNPVWMDVAEWAAANGMGVGQMGLNPSPSYASGGGLSTIISNILAKYPNTYIHFQTVDRVTSAADVQADITTATNLHARTIEWYEQDINNPSYQSLLQQWQQTVNSKFGGRGSAEIQTNESTASRSGQLTASFFAIGCVCVARKRAFQTGSSSSGNNSSSVRPRTCASLTAASSCLGGLNIGLVPMTQQELQVSGHARHIQ